MPTSRAQGQSGFTLIELLVTLVVLGVAIAIALPSFTGYRQRQALKAAAEEYVSLLAERRQEAIRSNVITEVDFRTLSAAGRLPPGVQVTAAPSMGTDGVVRIDPRRGTLTDLASAGSVTLGIGDYSLRFDVSAVGRGSVCVPSGSQSVPGYRGC